MGYRKFPPIYGRFDQDTIFDEERLKELLNLSEEDSCADWYGHYSKCYNAIIEEKARHLRDAIRQISVTAQRLREINRPVQKAIIVADTFGNELGLFRRGKELFLKRGGASLPIYVDTINGRISVEGWQPQEWERRPYLDS